MTDPSPETHVFVGMFRPPLNNFMHNANSKWDVFVCSCGSHLHYNCDIATHWRNGCMDTPVHKTIKEVVRMRND